MNWTYRAGVLDTWQGAGKVISLAIEVCTSMQDCNANANWQVAEDMCEAVQELFVGHARALEAQKRWEDAESAWVAAGEPGQAVAMHRQNGNVDAMFRAVSRHQPVSTACQLAPTCKIPASHI